MANAKFCRDCGNKLDNTTRFCGNCGSKQGPGASSASSSGSLTISNKSGLTAFLLCLFLGTLGAHRFYVGKIGTGILMLLTGGGLGLWYLYDLISIVCNNFSDSQGNLVEISRNPSAAKKVFMVVGSIFAGFLVFMFTLIILIMMLVGSMADVAQNELTAIRVGDLEMAYSFTSKDFQRNTSFAKFKRFIQLHPILKANVSASFPEREMKDNMGMVKGTFRLHDGSKLPISFLLIKEDKQWKIQGIDVNPPNTSLEPSTTSSPSSSNTNLTNTAVNKEFKYSIKYPDEWVLEQPNRQTVAFSWKKGSQTVYASINVQAIPSKKMGGIYSNTQDASDDLKKQITDNTTDVKFLDSGKVELPQNPKKIHGEYFIVTYNYHGMAMKKMQFILMKDNGDYIYTWGYTATAANFDQNLPLAQGMYESLIIE